MPWRQYRVGRISGERNSPIRWKRTLQPSGIPFGTGSTMRGRELSPNWAPIPFFRSGPIPETPVKCFFSVRVKNKHNLSSVCQNSPDFDVSYWSPRAFKPRLILAPDFTHPAPGSGLKTPIVWIFFPGAKQTVTGVGGVSRNLPNVPALLSTCKRA